MKEIIQRLKQQFTISNVNQQRVDLTFLSVKKEQAVSLISYLRDFEKFSHLVFLTAVDRVEDIQFQLTYMLHNYNTHQDLGIRVLIDREKAEMASIHHLWKQAGTYQRELKEMFGIDFPGSPRVDESFILEGWDNIPPMRRDFDTKKYSEETYFPRPGRESHDPESYMKSKLYPEGDA
ncbi:MAG: NADH-quinone oxidoreductase subunit C [Candidatus Marinimicrobia bacterium]|nr:NADH-quinone oxidoreductase subunit C [Candidatus Neomarinimicrobiota bacterium]